MGKRKRDEEYLRNKIRKLEEKIRRNQETHDAQIHVVEIHEEIHDASPEKELTAQTIQPPHDDHQKGSPTITQEQDKNGSEDIETEEDTLPEEFLQALGTEGEDSKEIGQAIRNELAQRWTKIMSTGLGKEPKELIMKKYPTPENFPNAVAPTMNPEILASLSEITLKRDKRIVGRQNTTGCMMSCLGKALTCLLKGEINTKILIEQINDAAKLAAEIYFQDSASRKFFALAGANQIVKEAVRDEDPDQLLFGKNCAEKIKSAQAIKKTGLQIKGTETTQKQQPPQKPNQVPTKRQENWRGPPQHQQYNRGRGGHRQLPKRQYNHSQSHYQPRDHKRQYRSRPSYRR